MSEENRNQPTPRGNDLRNLLIGVVGSLIAAAIWGVAAAVAPGALTKPLTLPLWGYLTLMTLFFIFFAWLVFFFLRRLREQAADYEETIEQWVDTEKEWTRINDEVADSRAEDNERWGEAQRSWTLANEKLKAELAREREIVFEGGLYYRATDTERNQPFCRLCRENADQLTTVRLYQERNGDYHYWCDACGSGFPVEVKPEPQSEDEDY